MTKNPFTLVPIGGLGQIGSNMFLIQTGKTNILIDAGILFPREDLLNINYLIPDSPYLAQIDYLLLTHGHEDHIGAVDYLRKLSPQMKIFCSPFTAALMGRKFPGLLSSDELNIFASYHQITIDGLQISFLPVAHSIPQTHALLITHPERNIAIFFASDFKLDPSMPENLSFPRLQQLLAPYRTKYAFVDSTNIEVPHATGSENDLLPHFRQLLTLKKRTFITLFSSNIQRIKNLQQLAIQEQRPLLLYGRSMVEYVQVAIAAKIMTDENLLFSLPPYSSVQAPALVILVSGCQGDFRGSLRRIAMGEDGIFTPYPDDLFVFSSKCIPGNENKINQIINKLYEYELEVVTDRTNLVHVSGHLAQQDHLFFHQQIQFDYTIPIHGEVAFLVQHQRFLQRHTATQPLLLFNFDRLSIDEAGKPVIEKSSSRPNPLIFTGNQVVLEREAISERRKMASSGICHLIIHGTTYQFVTAGLCKTAIALLPELEKKIKKQITQQPNDPENVRILIRQFFEKKIGDRPVAFVTIVRK